MKNTKQQGSFKLFFYPTRSGWCGVCPQFGIVDYYGDSSQITDLKVFKGLLYDACVMHLETAIEGDEPDENLNIGVSHTHTLNFWIKLLQHKCVQEVDKLFSLQGSELEIA